ncbi:hypothetical protein BS78_04G130300 [Paspalum vaginatum]|nr:hypothetical protein BS78_04G130300 [Paspalum vaginatum]
MATSRRELQPNFRANRGIRNMSPRLKPSESEQGLRRARSVPTSPDCRASPSPTSSSSVACRPSSSFNTLTTSSRSTSGSAASLTHEKTLHSTSYMASAKQTNTMRKKAEKPSATSVWAPALATPNTSSKDMTRAAKSPSTVKRSNLSTRPGIEKLTTSSVKPKTHKTVAGPLGVGKMQAVSSTRAPDAITKKRMGAENFVSIQRTRSVPARQKETPKIEKDVDLLTEFNETESISTSSIEEHLKEWLPDPIDLQSMDVTSKPASSKEEYKNEDNAQELLEDKQDGKHNELNAGANDDVGIKSGINILKGVTSETELKEVVDETELKEDASATELKKSANDTELNEAVSETAKEAIDKTKLKEGKCEAALKEAANEIDSRDAVAESELIVQEEAKTKEEKIMDDGRGNEATEEGRSKPAQERKNKVMALVGRFETAMSGRD